MFQISKVYIGIVPLMTSYERPGFSGYVNVNYKLYKKNRAMFKNRSITVKNSQVRQTLRKLVNQMFQMNLSLLLMEQV